MQLIPHHIAEIPAIGKASFTAGGVCVWVELFFKGRQSHDGDVAGGPVTPSPSHLSGLIAAVQPAIIKQRRRMRVYAGVVYHFDEVDMAKDPKTIVNAVLVRDV